MTRTKNQTNRRTKRSFTISPEAAAFLEMLCRRQQAASVSAVLEELLQQARRDEARSSIDKAVSDYYSSLTDDEVKEDALWGEFALTQFPSEENV